MHSKCRPAWKHWFWSCSGRISLSTDHSPTIWLITLHLKSWNCYETVVVIFQFSGQNLNLLHPLRNTFKLLNEQANSQKCIAYRSLIFRSLQKGCCWLFSYDYLKKLSWGSFMQANTSSSGGHQKRTPFAPIACLLCGVNSSSQKSAN